MKRCIDCKKRIVQGLRCRNCDAMECYRRYYEKKLIEEELTVQQKEMSFNEPWNRVAKKIYEQS